MNDTFRCTKAREATRRRESLNALERLATLHEQGTLINEEFATAKQHVLLPWAQRRLRTDVTL